MSRTLSGRVGRWSAVAVTAAMLSACGSGSQKPLRDPPNDAAGQTAEGSSSAHHISEDVWVDLSSLPRWHLMRAREMFMVHQMDDAARDFEAAGALVRLEAAQTDDAQLHHRLESAGIELRELGRSLQRQDSAPIQEVDDVLTRAYLALAQEHGEQATRAFHEGRPTPAATYMEQASAELKRAYERADAKMTPRLKTTLGDARAAARKLANGGSPNAIKTAKAALGELEKDSTQLENALGARGR